MTACEPLAVREAPAGEGAARQEKRKGDHETRRMDIACQYTDTRKPPSGIPTGASEQRNVKAF